MAEQPPDRLCVDPESPFYDEAVLERGVGVRFKGRERDDVEEYCVSEGWIRAPVGKTRDRKGNLLTIRFTGPVEAYFLTPSNSPSHSAQSVTPVPGGGEIAITAGSEADVAATIARWRARGARATPAPTPTPTQMDFGFAGVALDPDAHRLRVFAPA